LDVREEVIEFVETMKAKTGKRTNELLSAVGIRAGKYHVWRKRVAGVHHKSVPKGHWLLEREREAIIQFAGLNSEDGYRLLAYKMLDEGVVAASPSSVYRVLKENDLLGKWNRTRSETRGQGFQQPERAHEHWHVDIKYVNFRGTFLFLISIIDGWSRYIVHHELRQRMETFDVELTIQKALEKFPGKTPRIISDNGAQFLSKDFGEFLRESGLRHARTSVNYPQSNGKIERFHRTISEECLRRISIIDLEDARKQIAEYVRKYNDLRPHSAIFYLTPSDKLFGRVEEKLKLREKRLELARKLRKDTRNYKTISPYSKPEISVSR
jgi:putative transposase